MVRGERVKVERGERVKVVIGEKAEGTVSGRKPLDSEGVLIVIC